VLDLTVLSELTGGDVGLSGEVLDDFVEESRSDLASVRAACDAREDGELRRQAHRINGAARMVGAREVRELASQIEREAAAEDPDWQLLGGLLDPLAAALARVAAAAESRRERAT
jgi:HPt (histidine-containing phosphotransfer) domain-containing protein